MTEITRRRLLFGGAAAAVAAFVSACTRAGDPVVASATPAPVGTTPGGTLAPTPSCDDGDDPTPEQTEGPFFTPDSPEKTDLYADVSSGEKLLLTGAVLGTDCRPIAKALVDFWQADGDGNYDNDGYRLRGHQFTDAQGRYTLSTVVPGVYPGRTKHIHVRVQAPNGPILTTQLYFPRVAQNASDGIYRDECLISMSQAGSGAFDFVIET